MNMKKWQHGALQPGFREIFTGETHYNYVQSLLIHWDFNSWFRSPKVSRKEPKKKDDIHGFEIIFPFYINQNELAAVAARTT